MEPTREIEKEREREIALRTGFFITTIWQLPCSNFDLTALKKEKTGDKFGFKRGNDKCVYLIYHRPLSVI